MDSSLSSKSELAFVSNISNNKELAKRNKHHHEFKTRNRHMQQLKNHLPSAEEAALAKICSRELSAILETKEETQTLLLADSETHHHKIEIPSSALRLLVDVLTQLGEGNTVKLIPVHAELTTQEAADLLNISRPTFIKMLDEQVIPYTRSGNRRKVKFMDIQKYQNDLEYKRLEALDELSALDQELGLGYE